jgi:hypothetical protein
VKRTAVLREESTPAEADGPVDLAALESDALRELKHEEAVHTNLAYQLVGNRRDFQAERATPAVEQPIGIAVTTPMLVTAERFFDGLDRLADQFGELRHISIETVAITATATAASAAYVVWTLRTGYLAASMLSSLPAWMPLDPLPVLDFVRAKSRENRKDKATDLLAALREEL